MSSADNTFAALEDKNREDPNAARRTRLETIMIHNQSQILQSGFFKSCSAWVELMECRGTEEGGEVASNPRAQ